MNINLLERTRDYVLREPSAINMSEGICSTVIAKKRFNHVQTASCDTVGCIAGTGVMINMRLIGMKLADIKSAMGSTSWWLGLRDKAEAAFDIMHEQADRLFFEKSWPARFYNRLICFNPGTQEYAQVVADRIDYFIAKGC